MYDVGDKVVCVNDVGFPLALKPEFYADFPQEGKVYTIRDIYPSHGGNGQPNGMAVYLVEITNPANAHGIENGYAPERFKPLEEVKQTKTKKKEDLVEV